MNGQMTKGEQDLLLLERIIPASEHLYIWCFGEDGHYIASSCPEEDRNSMEMAFRFFGGIEKAMAHASSGVTVPLLIGSPVGMQWAVTFEMARGHSLIFAVGPVFYNPPLESQIQAALRPYVSTIEEGAWVKEMRRRLASMPVLPYAVFSRYVLMVHNVLTGQQLNISDLMSATRKEQDGSIPSPESRDRTKVYMAEKSLLKMVREGNINYYNVLDLSSRLSPGVPVTGKDPLMQSRISIIVFTSLVCRAAIEGGLSPEISYPLGDSYIDAVLTSRDTGELGALAQTMYRDFIYRVHQLKANPDYSAAIRKCCDYIELSTDRKIEIEDLATLTGYTPYYLTTKFKKETGIPLFLYIRRAKIERAKILLESTQLPVKEISENLAFSSQNFFIKCFHEITGVTPAQYRKLTPGNVPGVNYAYSDSATLSD